MNASSRSAPDAPASAFEATARGPRAPACAIFVKRTAPDTSGLDDWMSENGTHQANRVPIQNPMISGIRGKSVFRRVDFGGTCDGFSEAAGRRSASGKFYVHHVILTSQGGVEMRVMADSRPFLEDFALHGPAHAAQDFT
jgi:hypothetical protein